MTCFPGFTLAAVQAAPYHLNRDASTEKACHLIGEAAQKGATLAAFGETWLPGYPWWAWQGSWPGIASGPQIEKARMAYLVSGVEIPSPTTDRLCRERSPLISVCRVPEMRWALRTEKSWVRDPIRPQPKPRAGRWATVRSAWPCSCPFQSLRAIGRRRCCGCPQDNRRQPNMHRCRSCGWFS